MSIKLQQQHKINPRRPFVNYYNIFTRKKRKNYRFFKNVFTMKTKKEFFLLCHKSIFFSISYQDVSFRDNFLSVFTKSFSQKKKSLVQFFLILETIFIYVVRNFFFSQTIINVENKKLQWKIRKKKNIQK